MKRFENIFRTLFVLIVVILTTSRAIAQDDILEQMDSVEVGLLTCSPHNELYSLYGHSALLWHDLRTKERYVFNYGVFDYRKPHFVWRFMMGQTDYMLECTDHFMSWCNYYRKWGSEIKLQILNLTRHEKISLREALEENLKSPLYRYNFFYDNCSTRPRNIVEKCLEGKVTYSQRPGFEGASFRELVHLCTHDHPWAAFGNDLLLGLNADRGITQREQDFLPDFLSWGFDHALVERQGEKVPFVLRTEIVVPKGNQPLEREFPLSPLACTLLLLLVSVLIVVYEHFKRQVLVWWDAILMLVTGISGCVLFIMLFSEHPATTLNLQILVLNPLSLLFLPAVLRRKKTKWFVLMAVFTFMFLLGSFWQDYAEGMEIVALCLLLRYWIHRNDK